MPSAEDYYEAKYHFQGVSQILKAFAVNVMLHFGKAKNNLGRLHGVVHRDKEEN